MECIAVTGPEQFEVWGECYVYKFLSATGVDAFIDRVGGHAHPTKWNYAIMTERMSLAAINETIKGW